MSLRLWAFGRATVGQSSRLIANAIRPQARRLRYFLEVSNKQEFGIILNGLSLIQYQYPSADDGAWPTGRVPANEIIF